MGNRTLDSLVLRSDSMMTKIMTEKEEEIIEHIEGEKIECEQPINQVHWALCRWGTRLGITRPTGGISRSWST